MASIPTLVDWSRIDHAARALYQAVMRGSPNVPYGALSSAHKKYWKGLAAIVVIAYDEEKTELWENLVKEAEDADQRDEGSPTS